MEWVPIGISIVALGVAIFAQVRQVLVERKTRERQAEADEREAAAQRRAEGAEARADEAHTIAVRSASADLRSLNFGVEGPKDGIVTVKHIILNAGGSPAINVRTNFVYEGQGQIDILSRPPIPAGEQSLIEWRFDADKVPGADLDRMPRQKLTITYSDGMGDHTVDVEPLGGSGTTRGNAEGNNGG